MGKRKLDPMDIAQFGMQEKNARLQAGQTIARNAYQRTLTNQNMDRSLLGLDISGERQRNSLPGAFARGGTLNSGIYKDALSRYAQDQTYQREGFLLQAQQQLGGFNLEDQLANQQLQNALSNIKIQKKARRQQIAAQLRAVRR